MKSIICEDARVKCANCGAEYDTIPAITCPRCRMPLCSAGCDGCSAPCALVKSRSADSKNNRGG